jgi:hypothetical protein
MLDGAPQQLLLAALEVLVERARARGKPGRTLDLADAGAVEPALGEQLDRSGHQPLPRAGSSLHHDDIIWLDISLRP